MTRNVAPAWLVPSAAGYSSVISVASVGSDNQHSYFSQTNNDVELSAPGESIFSTMPAAALWWAEPRVDVTVSVTENGIASAGGSALGGHASFFDRSPTEGFAASPVKRCASHDYCGPPGSFGGLFRAALYARALCVRVCGGVWQPLEAPCARCLSLSDADM